jgi:hypothetical protein
VSLLCLDRAVRLGVSLEVIVEVFATSYPFGLRWMDPSLEVATGGLL